MLLGIRAKVRNGELLKWREAAGLSQAAAAEAAGVSHTVWNSVECLRFASRVSLDAVAKISAYVGVRIDDIWPESLRGQRVETTRTAYRAANPERLLSECSRKELMSLPAPDTDVMEPVGLDELKVAMDKALMTLTFREREVLKMRYGLGETNGHTYTLEECGKIFSVTRERIRGVEADAIRKLQSRARARPLEAFVKRPGREGGGG